MLFMRSRAKQQPTGPVARVKHAVAPVAGAIASRVEPLTGRVAEVVEPFAGRVAHAVEPAVERAFSAVGDAVSASPEVAARLASVGWDAAERAARSTVRYVERKPTLKRRLVGVGLVTGGFAAGYLIGRRGRHDHDDWGDPAVATAIDHASSYGRTALATDEGSAGLPAAGNGQVEEISEEQRLT